MPDEWVTNEAPLALIRYNEDVKEGGMPKRSTSQHVPKEMQVRFDEITQFTDAFCQAYLNDEYAQLCRVLNDDYFCRCCQLPTGCSDNNENAT